jgi:hypothetical protein
MHQNGASFAQCTSQKHKSVVQKRLVRMRIRAGKRRNAYLSGLATGRRTRAAHNRHGDCSAFLTDRSKSLRP